MKAQSNFWSRSDFEVIASACINSSNCYGFRNDFFSKVLWNCSLCKKRKNIIKKIILKTSLNGTISVGVKNIKNKFWKRFGIAIWKELFINCNEFRFLKFSRRTVSHKSEFNITGSSEDVPEVSMKVALKLTRDAIFGFLHSRIPIFLKDLQLLFLSRRMHSVLIPYFFFASFKKFQNYFFLLFQLLFQGVKIELWFRIKNMDVYILSSWVK